MKKINDKQNFIKNFCSVKDVKKMRKQATKLENIFTKSHI